MTHRTFDVWPGRPAPLGATYDGQGVNFAVFSSGATRVEVCFYDPADPKNEIGRVVLPEQTLRVHHGYIPGIAPGALYGLRAVGPWAPKEGLRYNGSKLLMDPYARALHGGVVPHGPIYGHVRGNDDLVRCDQDDSHFVPRSVVVDDAFDWEGDRRPDTRWHRTVLYEAHVKGFTALHPEVPPELRGTYAGFGHPSAVRHLQELGITAVELLPVHASVDEPFLHERGLTNYWGYSTLGYFAPNGRYAAQHAPGAVVGEFKGMVKALHRAGIEVILDVVYNHTCEGSQLGPTLSLRGLDNPAYYWLDQTDRRINLDFTGTGNSLDLNHPQTLKLVMDSLRYWVQVCHVDGFRFDLATTLARKKDKRYSPTADFLQAVHQDPVLSRVKLIAEPWDLSEGGYQVGNFPILWREWNGKFRDAVRKYWKGDESQAAELGWRLTGSADLFAESGRHPSASINFITAHDGFTMNDLVSYSHKHNEANGEDNRDGANDNHSWNGGVEGVTDDPAVLSLRERQKRNLMATLLLSQGVPMILGGDEMGRTQHGNNNGYCQDNSLSWVDWKLKPNDRAFLDFTKRLIRLRQVQVVLHRRRYFQGRQIWDDSELRDVTWFTPGGQEMKQEDWEQSYVRSLAYLLGGDAIPSTDEHGRRIYGDTLLVLLNAHHEDMPFTLPDIRWGSDWEVLVDTALSEPIEHRHSPAGASIEVKGRSVVVLRRPHKG